MVLVFSCLELCVEGIPFFLNNLTQILVAFLKLEMFQVRGDRIKHFHLFLLF